MGLITSLLEDGAGGVFTPTEIPLTAEEWITWNELAMGQEADLRWTITNILNRERTELPREPEAMRNWAAWLVLTSLDWIGMQ